MATPKFLKEVKDEPKSTVPAFLKEDVTGVPAFLKEEGEVSPMPTRFTDLPENKQYEVASSGTPAYSQTGVPGLGEERKRMTPENVQSVLSAADAILRAPSEIIAHGVTGVIPHLPQELHEDATKLIKGIQWHDEEYKIRDTGVIGNIVMNLPTFVENVALSAVPTVIEKGMVGASSGIPKLNIDAETRNVTANVLLNLGYGTLEGIVNTASQAVPLGSELFACLYTPEMKVLEVYGKTKSFEKLTKHAGNLSKVVGKKFVMPAIQATADYVNNKVPAFLRKGWDELDRAFELGISSSDLANFVKPVTEYVGKEADKMVTGITETTRDLTSWAIKNFTEKRGMPDNFYERLWKTKAQQMQALRIKEEIGSKLYHNVPEKSAKIAREMLETEQGYISWNNVQNFIIARIKEFPEKKSEYDLMVKTLKEARHIFETASEQHIKEGVKAGVFSDEFAGILRSNKDKYVHKMYRVFEDKTLREQLTKGTITIEEAMGMMPDLNKYLAGKGLTAEQIGHFKSLTPAGQKAFFAKFKIPEHPDLNLQVGRATGSKRGHYKARKDLEQNYKDTLDEIIHPALPMATSIEIVKKETPIFRLISYTAANPKWTAEIGPMGVAKGFKAMPNIPALGNLAGKQVYGPIADAFDELIGWIPKKAGMWDRAERIWQEVVNLWKVGKVPATPKSNIRNNVANWLQMDIIGGIPLTTVPSLYVKAAKEMYNKGKHYKKLINDGVVAGGFAESELKAYVDKYQGKDIFDHVYSSTVGALEGAANKMYSLQEQVGKVAVYLHHIEQGASPKRAIYEAEKVLYHYGKVGNFTQWFRSHALIGSPFATYTIKTIPRLLEVAVNNPARLYKYKIFFDRTNDYAIDYAAANFGGDKQNMIDRHTHFKIHNPGTILLIPGSFNQETGMPDHIDIGYYLPWTSALEMGTWAVNSIPGVETTKASSRGYGGRPSEFFPSPPARAVGEAVINYDIYKQKAIWGQRGNNMLTAKDLDSYMSENWWLIADHISKSALPTWAPGLAGAKAGLKTGGTDFRKIIDSLNSNALLPERARKAYLARKSDIYGETISMPSVWLDVVMGAKVAPTDSSFYEMQDILNFRRNKEGIRSLLMSVIAREGGGQEDIDKAMELFELRWERLEQMIELHETERGN